MKHNIANLENEDFDIEESFHTIDEIDAGSVTLRDVYHQEATAKPKTKSDNSKPWTYKNLNKIIFGASIVILAILVATTLGLIYGKNNSKSSTNTSQPENTNLIPPESENTTINPQNSKFDEIIPESKYTTKFRLPHAKYESLNDEWNKSEFLKVCTKLFEETPKKIECIGAEEGSIIVEIQSEFEPEKLKEIVPDYLNKVDNINGHSIRGHHFYSELKITKPTSDVLQIIAGKSSIIDLFTNADEMEGITYSVNVDDEKLQAKILEKIHGDKLELYAADPAEDTKIFEYSITLTAVDVDNNQTANAITVKVMPKSKNLKQQNKKNKQRDKRLKDLEIPEEQDAILTNRFSIFSNEENDEEDHLSDQEDDEDIKY